MLTTSGTVLLHKDYISVFHFTTEVPTFSQGTHSLSLSITSYMSTFDTLYCRNSSMVDSFQSRFSGRLILLVPRFITNSNQYRLLHVNSLISFLFTSF